MQLGAPAHRRSPVGLLPEAGDEGAQQEDLRQAHARVRRHLEGAELHQALAAAGGVRRVELVDAELGAMGVAGHVHQEVAQHPVHDPGLRHAPRGHLLEGDGELVEAVVAGLIHARRLAGGADEGAGEQIRQARVVLPEADEALHQIGAAQQRAVRRGRAAEGDVVAAAGAGVTAVEHELLGAQAREPGLFVEDLGVAHQLVPTVGGVHVDLDDARVRRHGELVDAMVPRRLVALDDDLEARVGGGILQLCTRSSQCSMCVSGGMKQ
jgi:hypothetical protein